MGVGAGSPSCSGRYGGALEAAPLCSAFSFVIRMRPASTPRPLGFFPAIALPLPARPTPDSGGLGPILLCDFRDSARSHTHSDRGHRGLRAVGHAELAEYGREMR